MRTLTAFTGLSLSFLSAACHADREATGPSSRSAFVPSLANPVVGQTVSCGAVIVADLKLENDLTCSGDALTVGADDVSIDLHGHTIAGLGTGNGITVRSRHGVSIKGGTIRGFVTGIFVAQSSDIIIKSGSFTQNREAVFFNGTSNSVVKANVVWQNRERGIMLRPTASGVISTNNQVVANELADNPSGILVFGQPGNTLKENTITRSTVGAIDLTGGGAAGNVIKGNLLTASAAGIKFGSGWTGNAIIGNTIQGNACGFQGPGAANTYKDNVLVGNTVDVCP